MNAISLKAVASSFPSTVVTNEFFGATPETAKSGMFRGARERRHLAPGETAVQLIAEATRKIQDQLDGEDLNDIDIILTNVSLPDQPFTGCGAEVAKALNINPQWVYDLHNHGCVAFISMIPLAQSLMTSTGAKKALLCNVQTAGGRIFSNEQLRSLPQACIPGDGCGVALLEVGNYRPIETVKVKCHKDYASDMEISSADERDWWEPGDSQFRIDFSRAKVAKVVERGNHLVPDVVKEACEEAGIKPEQIGTLVTNQPNPVFLRNWRDALEVPAEKHVDTFAEYGNLFGAGIPVSLERAMETGVTDNSDYVLLGGFSHAGDYSAAAVIKWNGEN